MKLQQAQRSDVVIIGTGVAGLFCALQFPAEKHVLLVTKSSLTESDSFLAQGGICMLKDPEDYPVFYHDTMKAGHFENNPNSVRLMIEQSPSMIQELVSYGVQFEMANGDFSFTKEAGHSVSRILYHNDLTGQEITSKLLSQVRERKNLSLMEYTELIDLIESEGVCTGVLLREANGTILHFSADYVVLATGGIGGLYQHSTNFPHLTGDALAIATRHHIALEQLHAIQIHPTTLYSTKPGRRFLISESVRGEGGILLNNAGKRFVDELLPRDLLTEAIEQQMRKEESHFVWLSLKKLGSDRIKERFPNIYRHCLSEGYDLTKEPIPVVPAQHYFMGGIRVDLNSATSMDRLYAIGETSCNGVHGANRLASNSLLESLVFAKRAANHILETYQPLLDTTPLPVIRNYSNIEILHQENRNIVIREIERSMGIEQHDSVNHPSGSSHLGGLAGRYPQ